MIANNLQEKIFNNPDVGSFNHRPGVRVRDNVSTTLPTGSTVTIDGVLLNNYDRVLFTNLSDPALNNRVYTVRGSNSSVTWTLEVDLNRTANAAPVVADDIFIYDGVVYNKTLIAWDGFEWIVLNPDITGGNNALQIDGTNTPIANISWNNFKIINLGNPTANLDAVNKAYVDTSIANIPSSIRTDGSNSPTANVDWGSHKITGLADPTSVQDAATKNYVDTQIADLPPETDPLSIHKDGSTSPTADISWAGHRITTLSDPTNASDAATKHYVDTSIAAIPPSTEPLSIHLNGDNSPTANIGWGGHLINNLGTPLVNTDAANKFYVDNSIANIPPSTEPLSIHLNGSNSPTADISWGTHKITALADPTNAQDAATKHYVDTTHPAETDPLSIHLSGNNSPIANIDWGGHKITNLADPSAAQDVATKNYVDTTHPAETDPLSIHLDGSTLPTANISMNNHKLIGVATPTASGDAATKGYVDSQISAIPAETDPLSIHKDGSTSPTADISWATHKITNLSDPTSAQDAATKHYVDTTHPAETDPLSIHLDGSSSPTANISFNGFKLVNVGTPTISTDGATKGYVDGLITAIPVSIHADGSNSPSANVSWASHKITNLLNPTAAQDAATKNYVDTSIAAITETDPLSIHKDGTTSPTNNINWGGFKITNLLDPSSAQDAATKHYVDTSHPAETDPLSLHINGDNAMNASIKWTSDNAYDIGTPDAGTTLLRPRSIFTGTKIIVGNLDGTGGVDTSVSINPQTGKTAFINMGLTSMMTDNVHFIMQPVGGGQYIWDSFNHVVLPDASFLMDTDNSPAASIGKNQIVAGTYTNYNWSRPYALHSGTRLTVGASALINTQPDAALHVGAPADKLIGSTSINNTTTVTASGTFFLRDVGIGDYIYLSGLTSTVGKVTAIASNTSMTVDTALGDGNPRNIMISIQPVTVTDNSGNRKFQIKTDGTVQTGDRQVLQGNYNVKLSNAQTTDATPTNLFALTLQPNSVYILECLVAVAKSDQSDRGAFKKTVTVYRNASGAATIQGLVFDDYSQCSDANLGVAWQVSGNQVQLVVTGEASIAVNWASTVRYQEFIDGV